MIKIKESNYESVLSKEFSRSKLLDSSAMQITKQVINRLEPLPVLFNDINESIMFEDYAVIAYGITPCGSKTTVVIEGVYPSVDIEFDSTISMAANQQRIKELCDDKIMLKNLKGSRSKVSVDLRKGKKLVGFSKKESAFFRIFFRNFWHRKQFIDVLKRKGIKSYNNDEFNYYRVVARQYKLALSGWNTLTNYSLSRDSQFRTKYVIKVDISDVSKFEGNNAWNPSVFRNDNTISMAFDIEQYSSDFDPNNLLKETRIPSGEVLDDVIFNIGMTFHFINNPKECLGLSLITEDCKPHKEYTTIVCDSEKTILLAFAFIIGVIQPDIIYEFNGSDFDWPNIYAKARLLNAQDKMLDHMSMKPLNKYDLIKDNKDKYIFTSEKIKISADMADKEMCNIRLQGYVAFDLRVSLMQLNPTESKSSLAFYLEIYNMQSKDDMPIPKLFGYYASKDYDGLGDVAKYCYVDCLRLHQLVHKINLIQDRRAVGLLSYTSLFDAFYRANSSKVRNLIVSHAIDKDLFYDSMKKEVKDEDKMEGKYPGALVLPPDTGLVNPLMSFEEFCKIRLKIDDSELIAKALELLKSGK